MNFEVILDHAVIQPPLAPPLEAVSTTSTSLVAEHPTKGAIVKKAKKSSQAIGESSHCCPKSHFGSTYGHHSLVLRKLPEEELLQSGLLRPMWHSLVLVFTQIFGMGWRWTMAGSKNPQEEKPVETTWQRKQGKQRQRKRKDQERRVLKPGWLNTLAISILCYAVVGCLATGNGTEGHTKHILQTGGRCDFRLEGTSEKSWAGSKPGSGGLPSQMSWQWTSGDKTSESAAGSFWEDGCQAESGTCPTFGQLAEIPKTTRGGVPDPKIEVPREAEAAERRTDQSGGRVCSGKRCSSGCSNSTRYWQGRGTTHCSEDGGNCSSRCPIGGHSAKEEARDCGCRRRSGPQKTTFSNSCRRIPWRRHEQDGFLIGRHASCHNGHVRRPHFFCLVEVKILDDTSAPESVGLEASNWWGLSTPQTCQSSTLASPLPSLSHTYGPRQAEYVAQLMRYDVETNRCNLAFHHCMWDDTMEALLHLDMIERPFRLDPDHHGIPWSHIERQIEGRPFWTLMGLESEEEHFGCIDWTGCTSQADRPNNLSDEQIQQLLESLEGDSQWACDFLSNQLPLAEQGIEFVSYGYFENYRGQRSTTIPLVSLTQWQELVSQQWDDFGLFRPFRFHLVHPHPPDRNFAVHVIIRSVDNPPDQHLLLTDQIDESSLDRNSRTVIAVSHTPNGYEVMLATANDLNTISSRTILKHGNVIWPLHRRLPVRDGQYWRILHENHEETISLLQSSVDINDFPQVTFSEGSPLCSHVLDRWCNIGGELRDCGDTDHMILMQQSAHTQIGSIGLSESSAVDHS